MNYNIPVKWELHSKKLFTFKKPYKGLDISNDDIIDIVEKYIDYISSLNIKSYKCNN